MSQDLCREHGMSRDTFSRYVTRFRTEGTDGFIRRSTAPACSVMGDTVARQLTLDRSLRDQRLTNHTLSARS
ncbi:helix-turn-helix domain-containing protein [Amycolatopsis tolypomycina]|uniref:helix-turn-helix domain-containing protein n=1 Tax=Amycolatopsis tolypomycina TaxID=208445 RepID=UPI0033B6B14F